MKSLGKVFRTDRGFFRVEFKDHYDHKCSITQSSLADFEEPGSSAIWIGVDDLKPQILDKDKGWMPFHVPKEVLFSKHMHLNRDQVQALIVHLQRWLNENAL
jgi:hypothetical protein